MGAGRLSSSKVERDKVSDAHCVGFYIVKKGRFRSVLRDWRAMRESNV
jgi:hypothetical protein